MTHPADADYTAFHVLSDEQIDDMVEAAVETANAISTYRGRRWTRLSRAMAEGTAAPPHPMPLGETHTTLVSIEAPPIIFNPPRVVIDDGHDDEHGFVVIDNGDDPPTVIEGWTLTPNGDPREATNWQAGIFEVAKEKAMAERIALKPTDHAVVMDLYAVTVDRVKRVRELDANNNPVVEKALTSIELGLLGLAKAIAEHEPESATKPE